MFQVKRSKLHEQTVGLDLTWKKIVNFLNENLEKSEMQSISEDLKDILQAAKQIGIVLFYFYLFFNRTTKVQKYISFKLECKAKISTQAFIIMKDYLIY